MMITFYTNFFGLNVPEDDIDYESLSIDYYWFFTGLRRQILPRNIYKQLYLPNCRQANERLSFSYLFETNDK